jgi:hypothetical protein
MTTPLPLLIFLLLLIGQPSAGNIIATAWITTSRFSPHCEGESHDVAVGKPKQPEIGRSGHD